MTSSLSQLCLDRGKDMLVREIDAIASELVLIFRFKGLESIVHYKRLLLRDWASKTDVKQLTKRACEVAGAIKSDKV